MESLSKKQRLCLATRKRSNGKTESIPTSNNAGSGSGCHMQVAWSCSFTPRGGRAMAKKRSASSARDRQTRKNAKHMADAEIDYSDIPASTAEELKRARRVGRPRTGRAKLLIAIRIDRRLLAELRRLAARQSKPYQTLIHELLQKAANRAA